MQNIQTTVAPQQLISMNELVGLQNQFNIKNLFKPQKLVKNLLNPEEMKIASMFSDPQEVKAMIKELMKMKVNITDKFELQNLMSHEDLNKNIANTADTINAGKGMFDSIFGDAKGLGAASAALGAVMVLIQM